MIISHKHKFIFVKTRKTAGSSIENFLYKKLGPDDICTGSPLDGTPRLNHPVEDGHVSAKWIKQHYPYEFENYFTFAVERNPWDKIVSFFYWYRNKKPGKTKKGFDEFVINNKKLENLNDWKMYTLDNKVVLNKILRYEDIHNEFKTIPVPYTDELLKTFLKTEYRANRHYKQMYTKTSTKNKVHRSFLNVIEEFTYSF